MLSVSLVAMFAAILSGAERTQTCQITKSLRGMSEAVAVNNQYNGSSYKTYLIRNAARDRNGLLESSIKAELIPERGGFDLNQPSGKRFGNVGNESGKWIISAYPGFMDACADHYVTLRRGAAGRMDVYDGLTKIGSIDRFPFQEIE